MAIGQTSFIDLAMRAYSAYKEVVASKGLFPEPLPDFSKLTDLEQHAWEAVARQIAKDVGRDEPKAKQQPLTKS